MNLVSVAQIERLVDKVNQKREKHGIEPIAVEMLNHKYALYAKFDSFYDCVISLAVKGDTNDIESWKFLRTVDTDNPYDAVKNLNSAIRTEENFIEFGIDDLWFV